MSVEEESSLFPTPTSVIDGLLGSRSRTARIQHQLFRAAAMGRTRLLLEEYLPRLNQLYLILLPEVA